MALYAQLGFVAFELLYVNNFSSERSESYAEQPRVTQKPELQWTGTELQRIRIGLRFHIDMTNPESQIRALRRSMAQHEPLPLLFANGAYKGDFVIASIAEQVIDTDAQGGILDAQLEVELVEGFETDAAKRAERQAKASSFARASSVQQTVRLSAASISANPPAQPARAAAAIQVVKAGGDSKRFGDLVNRALYDSEEYANAQRVAATLSLRTSDIRARLDGLQQTPPESLTRLQGIADRVATTGVADAPAVADEMAQVSAQFQRDMAVFVADAIARKA